MGYIPYGKQNLDKGDIKAVLGVLSSDWLTQGPEVEGFERALASYCGAKYAVAVSSGTAALHIACLAAGLKEGDEAVTTPMTFLATANAIVYTGASPVFADIKDDTIAIDPSRFEERITSRTRAVLPVHFAGFPAEMETIHKIASRKKIKVIEDACHALGAVYRGGKVGNCRYSDMTVFSFHPVKAITTGEGGAITTNDDALFKKLRALRSHGMYKDKKTSAKGGWYYEMRDLGFNYRITDIQCALGKSQLAKIGKFTKERRMIADLYDKKFACVNDLIRTPSRVDEGSEHAFHLYLLRLRTDRLKCSRKEVFEFMHENKIRTQVHYIPIYKQPYYRKRYGNMGKFPVSEKYYKETLSLPIYPGLGEENVKKVSDLLIRLVQSNVR